MVNMANHSNSLPEKAQAGSQGRKSKPSTMPVSMSACRRKCRFVLSANLENDGYNTYLTMGTGATGLFQFKPETANLTYNAMMDTDWGKERRSVAR